MTEELIGKSIEVTFWMTYKGKGKRKIKDLFGCPGTITQISDENTMIKRKKIGPGWVFIEYKDGSEDWQLLRPTFHNTKRAGSWRLIDDADADLDLEYELEDDENEGGQSDESGSDESDSDDSSESDDD